jgi:hypothetical protein
MIAIFILRPIPYSVIPTHQAPIAGPSPTGTQIKRISFLVNAADKAKIGSLQNDFEAAGFAWQKPIFQNTSVTEIRIAAKADSQLADFVQKILKQKYNIDSTIDPTFHSDLGRGYVQVSLAKGALK